MFYEWKPYVPVAQRRAEALRHLNAQRKKGAKLEPVVIEGRTIATSYWGKSWCDNLESYSDYSNRLPRGRSYVRNGSVVDLRIEKGTVAAAVSGSSLYKTQVKVKALSPKSWKELVRRHASQVASVVELLQGKLPKSLLEALADRASGLFPAPRELEFSCSCPDWAEMCKHVAAVLYGVGSRLDAQPELFFLLRGVEVTDLAARGAAADFGAPAAGDLVAGDLGALFGIELEGSTSTTPIATPRRAAKKHPAQRKSVCPRRRPSTPPNWHAEYPRPRSPTGRARGSW